MKTIFWILLFLIIYCYFGYPLILSGMAQWRAKPVRKSAFEPTVSIVLSLHNEEDVIEGKIKNFLALDYPPDRIEILIGSDGSTDQTNDIVKRFMNSRIHLFERDQRMGKSITINDLVQKAKNEIIVFTDARQIFAKDAVRQLVNNFADSTIGCVSGELIFFKKEGGTAQGINLYWKYEKLIRKNESQIHSMLGATGAIYAIRRELFTQVPERVVLDDMYIPLKVIQRAYRAIFDEEAKAYDQVADSPREEHRRKARTLYGNYQIFFLFSGMFIPLKSPIAIQLFSHKFLRVVIPFFLIVIFFINWALKDEPIFAKFFFLQIFFYLMAMLGALARNQKYGILRLVSKVCFVPYVFCLLNFSALIGFLRFLGAKQEITWEKARGK